METVTNTVLEIAVSNLSKVGLGLAVFGLAYLANMAFSMYYNIRIMGEKFSWLKIKESGIKVGSFIFGTFCLTLSLSCILPWAMQSGLTIPQEYEDVISTISILAICLTSTIKYVIEAYGKMNGILEMAKVKTKQKEIEIERIRTVETMEIDKEC